MWFPTCLHHRVLKSSKLSHGRSKQWSDRLQTPPRVICYRSQRNDPLGNCIGGVFCTCCCSSSKQYCEMLWASRSTSFRTVSTTPHGFIPTSHRGLDWNRPKCHWRRCDVGLIRSLTSPDVGVISGDFNRFYFFVSTRFISEITYFLGMRWYIAFTGSYNGLQM